MKIAAFGEVMLRFTPPEYLQLEQTNQLRMSFTGTGVNILSNLAHFGFTSYLITAVPENRLGDAAQAALRQLGIRDDYIHQCHDHIGSYFAEMGFGSRPTQVTYQNRLNSSFGVSDETSYPFEAVLDEAELVHICGISLSLTDATRSAAHHLAKLAHQKGVKVCFDFNFRPSLNTEPDKAAFMRKQYEAILPYCDVVFGSKRDLTDLLGMADAEEAVLVRQFMKDYQIEWFAGTHRHSETQEISGFLYSQDREVESKRHGLQVLDRIGGGDGYAAGVLLGYGEQWSLSEVVEFGITNAVLAHTIQDDVPLTTRKMVQTVMENPTIDLIR